MRDDISDYKMVKKVFARGRWHAVLDSAFRGSKMIPLANYVWLKGNPTFEAIPKDYVIHHLDHDETNDDISNLALMYKHHHVAHHWKQKTDEVEISLFEGNTKIYSPSKEPKYCKLNDRERYCVWFMDTNLQKRIRLYQYQGKPLITEEDARWCIDCIWPIENQFQKLENLTEAN